VLNRGYGGFFLDNVSDRDRHQRLWSSGRSIMEGGGMDAAAGPSPMPWMARPVDRHEAQRCRSIPGDVALAAVGRREGRGPNMPWMAYSERGPTPAWMPDQCR